MLNGRECTPLFVNMKWAIEWGMNKSEKGTRHEPIPIHKRRGQRPIGIMGRRTVRHYLGNAW